MMEATDEIQRSDAEILKDEVNFNPTQEVETIELPEPLEE